MSPEETRELFSEAYEGALAPDAKAAFERALEADIALADEYAGFCRALELMRARPQPQPPNLLAGVQRRLRMQKRVARLQKRFGLGGIHPLALGLIMLALAGLVWLALELVQTSLIGKK